VKRLTKDMAKGKFENLRIKIKGVLVIVTGRSKREAMGADHILSDEHRERVEEGDSVTSIRMTSIRTTSMRMKSTRSQCENCQHFRPWFRGRTTCDAYPEDIPAEITANRVDHHMPYVGDHGFRYKAIHPEDNGEDSAEDGVETEQFDNGVGTEDR